MPDLVERRRGSYARRTDRVSPDPERHRGDQEIPVQDEIDQTSLQELLRHPENQAQVGQLSGAITQKMDDIQRQFLDIVAQVRTRLELQRALGVNGIETASPGAF